MKNARFKEDLEALEPGCPCYTCRNHTRAYLHHLFRLKEMTVSTLLSIHNISYLHQETTKCRQAILAGNFKEYFEQVERALKKTDAI